MRMLWLNSIAIRIRPKTKLSRREQNKLKETIKHRLRTMDKSRRLSDRVKPRIRYKLKTYTTFSGRRIWQ